MSTDIRFVRNLNKPTIAILVKRATNRVWRWVGRIFWFARWHKRILRSFERFISASDWNAFPPSPNRQPVGYRALTNSGHMEVARVSPVPAAQPAPARSLRALASERHMGHELSPRQVYERNVKFNRAKVLAQASEGLQ